MEKEKPSYYSITPADVRYNNKLSPFARLLYGEITCLTNKEGYCFASNNYFAELYEVTPQAVSKWIKSLEAYGYIRIEYIRNGKEIVERKIYLRDSNLSTTVDTYQPEINKGINTGLIGYQPQIKDNNTRDNNTSINISKKTKKQFVPPTKEEVKQYCEENNLHIDIDRFFSYYGNDWKDRENRPVKNWKQRVRTWANNNYGNSFQNKKGSLVFNSGTDDISQEELDNINF